MKVTKYPHSCFKIEKNTSAILIDLGNLSVENNDIDIFGSFDAVLLTHEHPDHAFVDALQLISDKNIAIYANKSVINAYPTLNITEVEYDSIFKIQDFTIKPVEMTHSAMVDGTDGPENTAYLIDDKLLHVGDSNQSLHGVNAEIALVPICGPDITMKDAHDVAKSVRAKKIIPMHYDNPVFYSDPNAFKERLPEYEIYVLKPGESVEI